VITYLGSVSDGDTSKEPTNYQLYQSIINGVFGTAGVALGVLGLLGGKGPKEEEVPEEEAPVEGEEEEPALRQAEEEEPAEGEETELAPVEEEGKPGTPLATWVGILGLLSGGSTLGLYFLAAETKNAYEDIELYLNLAASGLALVLGTVTLIDFLGSRPEAPEEEVAPEDAAAEEVDEAAIL
jgi:hypothetical protein